MVIIKCNVALPDEQRRSLEINIHDQAADGIIVLPHFCDLLTATKDSDGVQIVQPAQDARVAELEQELARAMFYISAQKDCTTCKHENSMGNRCCADCAECKLDGCRCRNCYDGCSWEWIGLNG